jgi:hypothetical protein
LSHCATSRKVTGSIPDEIIDIFNLSNPSSRTMAQKLVQESSWGVKHDRRVRLITSPPPVIADCVENVGSSTPHREVGPHGHLQQ